MFSPVASYPLLPDSALYTVGAQSALAGLKGVQSAAPLEVGAEEAHGLSPGWESLLAKEPSAPTTRGSCFLPQS